MEVLKEIVDICYVNDCGGLKVGILANFICLYLGLYVLVGIERSSNMNRGKNIIKEFFLHHGYSLYLISGGALIGVLPFKSTSWIQLISA